ncbi:hypothetical protein Tco_0238554 [Tanacetum coccineum]
MEAVNERIAAAAAAMDVDTIHNRIKQLLTQIQTNNANDSNEDAQLIISQIQGKVDEIVQQYSDVTALPDHHFGNISFSIHLYYI